MTLGAVVDDTVVEVGLEEGRLRAMAGGVAKTTAIGEDSLVEAALLQSHSALASDPTRLMGMLDNSQNTQGQPGTS